MKNIEHASGSNRWGLSRFHSCLIVVGILNGTLLASADPGYLARIGPAPLRFRAVAPPSTNHFVLPPPAPEPPPEPAKPVATTATNSLDMSATSVPGTATNIDNASITNQIQIPTAVEPLHPDEVVSPQMLLRFFGKSTNGTSASVIAPIEFTPPRSEVPPSKATFTTGP